MVGLIRSHSRNFYSLLVFFFSTVSLYRDTDYGRKSLIFQIRCRQRRAWGLSANTCGRSLNDSGKPSKSKNRAEVLAVDRARPANRSPNYATRRLVSSLKPRGARSLQIAFAHCSQPGRLEACFEVQFAPPFPGFPVRRCVAISRQCAVKRSWRAQWNSCDVRTMSYAKSLTAPTVCQHRRSRSRSKRHSTTKKDLRHQASEASDGGWRTGV